MARETLEGHQRAIMGSMTVEEIYKDRKTFSQRVFEVASTDLMGMGLIVISYTLKDLNDEEGYLKVRTSIPSNDITKMGFYCIFLKRPQKNPYFCFDWCGSSISF